MTTFPARPGSFLINLEDPNETLPIVGWCQVSGPKVMPLVIGRLGPLVSGDAIEAESGRVLDLTTAEFHESAEDWREAMSGSDAYRPGTVLWPVVVAPAAPKPVAAAPAPKAPVAPARKAAAPAPVIVDGIAKLVFDGNLYAKQSFWQVPEDEPKLVFNLEPDSQAPKVGAKKITREQFAIMRKSIREVTSAELREGVSLLDEPELTLAEPPEEDDADDMI